MSHQSKPLAEGACCESSNCHWCQEQDEVIDVLTKPFEVQLLRVSSPLEGVCVACESTQFSSGAVHAWRFLSCKRIFVQLLEEQIAMVFFFLQLSDTQHTFQFHTRRVSSVMPFACRFGWPTDTLLLPITPTNTAVSLSQPVFVLKQT